MSLRGSLVAAVCLVAALGVGDGTAAASAVRPQAADAVKKCSKHRGHFKSKAGRRWHKRHCRQTAPAPGGGGGEQPSGGGPAPCPNTAAAPGRLSAQEDDTPLPYRIKLSATAIDCGRVIVEQQNVGEDPHDLVVKKTGDLSTSFFFAPLDPGLTARQDLDLTRGSWVLYCSLPGHREAGMERTLTVD